MKPNKMTRGGSDIGKTLPRESRSPCTVLYSRVCYELWGYVELADKMDSINPGLGRFWQLHYFLKQREMQHPAHWESRPKNWNQWGEAQSTWYQHAVQMWTQEKATTVLLSLLAPAIYVFLFSHVCRYKDETIERSKEKKTWKVDGRDSREYRADPVRAAERAGGRWRERGREVIGGSCVPASPLWLGTCWAIWRPCNWVGVLHLSGTPPKRWLERKRKKKKKQAVYCIPQRRRERLWKLIHKSCVFSNLHSALSARGCKTRRLWCDLFVGVERTSSLRAQTTILVKSVFSIETGQILALCCDGCVVWLHSSSCDDDDSLWKGKKVSAAFLRFSIKINKPDPLTQVRRAPQVSCLLWGGADNGDNTSCHLMPEWARSH